MLESGSHVFWVSMAMVGLMVVPIVVGLIAVMREHE